MGQRKPPDKQRQAGTCCIAEDNISGSKEAEIKGIIGETVLDGESYKWADAIKVKLLDQGPDKAKACRLSAFVRDNIKTYSTVQDGGNCIVQGSTLLNTETGVNRVCISLPVDVVVWYRTETTISLNRSGQMAESVVLINASGQKAKSKVLLTMLGQQDKYALSSARSNQRTESAGSSSVLLIVSASSSALYHNVKSEVLWSGSDPKAESKPLLTASGQQTEPAKLLTVLGQNRVYAQIKCVKSAGEVSDDDVGARSDGANSDAVVCVGSEPETFNDIDWGGSNGRVPGSISCIESEDRMGVGNNARSEDRIEEIIDDIRSESGINAVVDHTKIWFKVSTVIDCVGSGSRTKGFGNTFGPAVRICGAIDRVRSKDRDRGVSYSVKAVKVVGDVTENDRAKIRIKSLVWSKLLILWVDCVEPDSGSSDVVVCVRSGRQGQQYC